MPQPKRLNLVTPDPEMSRQDIFRVKIEQRRRELANEGFKVQAYERPERRGTHLDENEASRRGTLWVDVAEEIPWRRRLLRWIMRKV